MSKCNECHFVCLNAKDDNMFNLHLKDLECFINYRCCDAILNLYVTHRNSPNYQPYLYFFIKKNPFWVKTIQYNPLTLKFLNLLALEGYSESIEKYIIKICINHK